MALREKPKTMKETVDALWYVIIGTNGDGFNDRLKRLEGGKKPKRMELLTIVIAGIALLQSIGLFDAIRAGLYTWFSGSAPGAG